jgi:hypothetical protein
MMQSYDGIHAIPTNIVFFALSYYDKGAKSMTLLLTPFGNVVIEGFSPVKTAFFTDLW